MRYTFLLLFLMTGSGLLAQSHTSDSTSQKTITKNTTVNIPAKSVEQLTDIIVGMTERTAKVLENTSLIDLGLHFQSNMSKALDEIFNESFEIQNDSFEVTREIEMKGAKNQSIDSVTLHQSLHKILTAVNKMETATQKLEAQGDQITETVDDIRLFLEKTLEKPIQEIEVILDSPDKNKPTPTEPTTTNHQ